MTTRLFFGFAGTIFGICGFSEIYLLGVKTNGWQGLAVLAALSLGLALLVSTWHRRREW